MNKFKTVKGFTIVELLVVLAIFALIISVSLANYNSSNRQSKLKMSLQNLSANIRLTQSYAIGSKDFYDSARDRTIVPRGGWGILLDKTRPAEYKIVTDLDDDHQFVAETDGVYKTLNFDDDIVIDEIMKNESESTDQALIFFQPPDPQVFINGENNNNIKIYLKDKVNNISSAVSVNFFGLIENE
ncbi:MAG TPA: prepilin-type N-terminal cleavage/methylation domain-containing protein [bacterium]|nr:prepilin-type N-terminal cleavage/methylation domain-containing protein [bacterium]